MFINFCLAVYFITLILKVDLLPEALLNLATWMKYDITISTNLICRSKQSSMQEIRQRKKDGDTDRKTEREGDKETEIIFMS